MSVIRKTSQGKAIDKTGTKGQKQELRQNFSRTLNVGPHFSEKKKEFSKG